MDKLLENQDHNQEPSPNPQEIQEILEKAIADLVLEKYVFRLYVAGKSPKSVRALENIAKICEEYLPGRYELEVIDIYQQPELLEQEQIFAVPTLVKELPPPLQKLIGDMSNTEKVIISLDL